jgi:hypothetical protein
MNETVTIFALYGIPISIALDLDFADSDWLERHCVVVSYALDRCELSVGMFTACGVLFEVVDARIVNEGDEKHKMAVRSTIRSIELALHEFESK